MRQRSLSNQSAISGQSAIVTGATRGIGLSIARRLRDLGASVFGVGRDTNLLSQLEQEGIQPLRVDVTDRETVSEAVARVQQSTESLDILVNNAGLGIFGSLGETSWDDFRRMLEVNVGGPFLFSQLVVPHMLAQGRGEILNVASVVGVKGYPQQCAYGASKHALVGLTKSLAAELHGTGVRVRSICPGAVDTDMVAAARADLDRSGLIQAEDIADGVEYLLCAPKSAVVDNLNIRREGSNPWF